MQAPVEPSQAVQRAGAPLTQQLAWQSEDVHCSLAVHVVPPGARHFPAEAVYPLEQAVQTPDPSQVEQNEEVAAAQQVVWQSPDVHWLSAEQAAPELSSVQSPATTE